MRRLHERPRRHGRGGSGSFPGDSRWPPLPSDSEGRSWEPTARCTCLTCSDLPPALCPQQGACGGTTARVAKKRPVIRPPSRRSLRTLPGTVDEGTYLARRAGSGPATSKRGPALLRCFLRGARGQGCLPPPLGAGVGHFTAKGPWCSQRPEEAESWPWLRGFMSHQAGTGAPRPDSCPRLFCRVLSVIFKWKRYHHPAGVPGEERLSPWSLGAGECVF